MLQFFDCRSQEEVELQGLVKKYTSCSQKYTKLKTPP